MTTTRRQRGVTTVEFAIVGLLLFVLVFAVIEFGRIVYTLNMLREGARRAARVAAVCTVKNPEVLSKAVFIESEVQADVGLKNLKAGNVRVQYLDGSGGDSEDYSAIQFVKVTISGYRIDVAIPFVNPTLVAPDVVVTLPRESLGIPRSGEPPACD